MRRVHFDRQPDGLGHGPQRVRGVVQLELDVFYGHRLSDRVQRPISDFWDVAATMSGPSPAVVSVTDGAPNDLKTHTTRFGFREDDRRRRRLFKRSFFFVFFFLSQRAKRFIGSPLIFSAVTRRMNLV